MRHWTTAVTSLGAMLMTLTITVVNVALPKIGADLHANLASLQWIVNAYTLPFAALLLTAGSLSDRIGRRKIFMAGVALFTVASVLGALAPNVGVLVTASALQGIGGAMVMGTSLALISDTFDNERDRNVAISIFTAGGAASAALGPLVGGLLVQELGWQFIYLLNVPIGLIILFGTVRGVPETPVRDVTHKVDVLGAVLVVAALFAVNYGLLTGAKKGWQAGDVLIGLIGGGVLLIAFVAVQWRRRERAMLDLRLFRIPSFTGAMVLSFAARILSLGVYPYLILWLSGTQGLTPLQIGLVLLIQSVALVVGAPLGGILQKVMPTSVVLAISMAMAGVGMLLAVRIASDGSWTVLVVPLLVLGLGLGLGFPVLLGVAVGVVPPARAGTASGAANSFFPLGTATGVAVFGAILTAEVDDPNVVGTAFTGALSTIFLIAGITGLIAAAASLLLIRAKDSIGLKDPVPAREQVDH
jgi:EmrB/QacA subfamily drug resistance transporter